MHYRKVGYVITFLCPLRYQLTVKYYYSQAVNESDNKLVYFMKNENTYD